MRPCAVGSGAAVCSGPFCASVGAIVLFSLMEIVKVLRNVGMFSTVKFCSGIRDVFFGFDLDESRKSIITLLVGGQ